MPSERRQSHEFIADITVAPDGLPVRTAKHWTRDKLGILTSYLASYGRACARARSFHFVDAMAGYGRCLIEDTGDHLLGSTLIALESRPQFTSVLALEHYEPAYEALATRAERYGGRAIVAYADCNRDLWRLMETHIPRRSPSFVLLDPEGAELQWQTISSVARFREGPLKAELLILFATEWLPRMMPVEAQIETHNEVRLDQVFPPSCNWREIWGRRREGRITPGQARSEYLAGYMQGLRDLGYRSVLPREIRRRDGGALVYHLVFATDHPAGERIMDDVFGHMRANDSQGRLFG